MRFVTFADAVERLRGKSVAIVGSGPGSLDNEPGFVDSHEVVVRVNNYKTGERQGQRADVFYSFFGGSIRKSVDELKRDGVALCMCKLPDGKPIHSPWHEASGKFHGVDYRYIFALRRGWWFCDTFVPPADHFLAKFDLLGQHQPTTGFAAILDVLAAHPASVYLTGFDFFTSGVHNVDEPWREKNSDDPIGHRPDLERAWIRDNLRKHPIALDRVLQGMIA